ncbi:MAG TPA: thiol reductant ABC exporter subunit CydD [Candidatus Limnocylindrales bacterium]
MRAFDPRLIRYARATSVALAAAVALGIATAGLAVAQAWLLATAITSAFMGGAGFAELQTTLIALAIVLASRAGVAWAQESVARQCSAAVKSSLRMQLLRHVATRLPGRGGDPDDGHASGEVVALATRGLDSLDAYFGRYLPQAVLAVIVPLVVIACLATADLVATLTVALTIPLIPFFMALIGSYTVRRRQRRWDALARLSGHFLDVVTGLPTLRVFGRSAAQLGRLERVTSDYRRESMATLRVAFLSAFALELAATLSVALVAVGVGLRLVDGSLDLRTGLFVLILAPEAYLPLRNLGSSFHASEEGMEAAGRVFRIIEDTTENLPGIGNARVPDLRGAEIRIDALTVHQHGRALDAPFEASLSLRAGEVVAVAGPSGAGKSTLIDVLLGLRNADEGNVSIVGADGLFVPVSELDREAWHRAVAWVPQHPYCFPGTVAENIRLAAPNATDAAVRGALAAVDLADIDPATPLGEAGAGLSSGQRRRVGVARALLRDAHILILDEPTAGLDAAAEDAVLASVRAAARDRNLAVLLIAHRPSALAIADRVVTIASRSDEVPA